VHKEGRSASFEQIQEGRVGGDCKAELPKGDRFCLEEVELLECWGVLVHISVGHRSSCWSVQI